MIPLILYTDLRLILVWSWRGFLTFLYLLFIGFSIVLPIDSIVQATESSNDALNTFIVVGAIAFFLFFSIIILAGRAIYYRSCLKDIPRYYIPLTPNDLPHKPSRHLVLEKLEKSKKLSVIFKIPNLPVIHPGFEPPRRCDDPNYEKLFPEYLNYSVCIKNISDRLKYQGIFLNNVDPSVNLQDTISDLIRNKFILNSNDEVQIRNANDFIDLYEYLRYSGKEVERADFIKFVQLCIYFVDLTINKNDLLQRSTNNSDDLDDITTRNTVINQNPFSSELSFDINSFISEFNNPMFDLSTDLNTSRFNDDTNFNKPNIKSIDSHLGRSRSHTNSKNNHRGLHDSTLHLTSTINDADSESILILTSNSNSNGNSVYSSNPFNSNSSEQDIEEFRPGLLNRFPTQTSSQERVYQEDIFIQHPHSSHLAQQQYMPSQRQPLSSQQGGMEYPGNQMAQSHSVIPQGTDHSNSQTSLMEPPKIFLSSSRMPSLNIIDVVEDEEDSTDSDPISKIESY
ncbi:hypothetical protein TBLA_0B09270 [Henningerozyma blattae CBS 6284]|uniref:Defect at low temperature protein 1 n=1 Tax=Henningerozyma blattae (strain ATCC 34711 / CBS 6284 / DSM 70876 / NBRC 10599 / NRRL Y-10934 / UCD 77-7) TaxID=1071380 RepID=I2H042_HENB6|nr:hypothetical protein TBLA_0B09270 [Tetrapisispora blattae CBS 6284]CCH59744.1 hypothetical protein TBLA_0B09270 [Tetrapisispora blattae CBS 6284]